MKDFIKSFFSSDESAKRAFQRTAELDKLGVLSSTNNDLFEAWRLTGPSNSMTIREDVDKHLEPHGYVAVSSNENMTKSSMFINPNKFKSAKLGDVNLKKCNIMNYTIRGERIYNGFYIVVKDAWVMKAAGKVHVFDTKLAASRVAELMGFDDYHIGVVDTWALWEELPDCLLAYSSSNNSGNDQLFLDIKDEDILKSMADDLVYPKERFTLVDYWDDVDNIKDVVLSGMTFGNTRLRNAILEEGNREWEKHYVITRDERVVLHDGHKTRLYDILDDGRLRISFLTLLVDDFLIKNSNGEDYLSPGAMLKFLRSNKVELIKYLNAKGFPEVKYLSEVVSSLIHGYNKSNLKNRFVSEQALLALDASHSFMWHYNPDETDKPEGFRDIPLEKFVFHGDVNINYPAGDNHYVCAKEVVIDGTNEVWHRVPASLEGMPSNHNGIEICSSITVVSMNEHYLFRSNEVGNVSGKWKGIPVTGHSVLKTLIDNGQLKGPYLDNGDKIYFLIRAS